MYTAIEARIIDIKRGGTGKIKLKNNDSKFFDYLHFDDKNGIWLDQKGNHVNLYFTHKDWIPLTPEKTGGNIVPERFHEFLKQDTWCVGNPRSYSIPEEGYNQQARQGGKTEKTKKAETAREKTRVSICCKGAVRAEGNVTKYYVCSLCNKPCDTLSKFEGLRMVYLAAIIKAQEDYIEKLEGIINKNAQSNTNN